MMSGRSTSAARLPLHSDIGAAPPDESWDARPMVASSRAVTLGASGPPDMGPSSACQDSCDCHLPSILLPCRRRLLFRNQFDIACPRCILTAPRRLHHFTEA